MATELRNVPTTDINQTRFFGGHDRGVCIQVTMPGFLTVENRGSFQSIHLTKEQARLLAQELLMFANNQEVVKTDAS